ncbi:LuxR family transcriptional regulator [Pseudonocardia zijingensis]|uniref:LuxR family transcriptional regulator n=2 Tax=Pseudonocardia zijingensis TaxID=153376 RepID=A0ABP3ZKJ1_9PSEU
MDSSCGDLIAENGESFGHGESPGLLPAMSDVRFCLSTGKPPPLTAGPPGGLRPRRRLWGRDRELARVARITDPRAAQAIVVAGEAGIGKTSIWTAGLAAARAAGLRLVTTVSSEAEVDLPCVGLDDLLGELLDQYGGQLSDLHRDALACALLRRSDLPEPSPRVLAVSVLALLRSAVDDEPLVLAIDDLQWTDLETQRCLAYAVRRLWGRPLRLLLAIRTPSPWWPPQGGPTGSALLDALPAADTVYVGPLSPAAMRHVLAAASGTPVSAEQAQDLADSTGGNPFWALQLAQARRVPGPPEPESDDGFAPSVTSLVTERVAALPPRVRETVEVIAAMGRPSPSDVVRALDDPSADDPGQLLDLALATDLVVARGGRFLPAHPLIGTALLASIPGFRRRRLHLRLAESSTAPEARAHHMLAARTIYAGPGDPGGDTEDRGDLLATLDAAALAAARRGAIAAAARFADQAFTNSDAADPYRQTRLIRSARYHYRAAELLTAHRQFGLVDLASLDPDLLDEVVPLFADTAGRLFGRQAVAHVRKLLEELPDDIDPHRRARRAALLLTLRAHSFYGDERSVEASRAAVDATAAARSAASLQHWALGHLIEAEYMSGREPADDLVLCRAALERSVPRELLGMPTDVLRAMVMVASDDIAPARTLLERVREAALAAGDDSVVIIAGTVSGYLELVCGRSERCAAHLQEVDRIVDPDAPEAAVIVCMRGMLHIARGEFCSTRTMLAALDADGVAPSDRSDVVREYLRGQLALYEYRFGDAVEHLRTFLDFNHRRGRTNPAARLGVDVDLGYALAASGDLEGAEEVARTLVEAANPGFRSIAQGCACRIRARVAQERGDEAAVVAFAEAAVEHHSHTERLPELGRSLVVLAEALVARDPARASETADRARAILLQCGQLWWADRAARISRSPVPAGDVRPTLSPSERAVAELVANGDSNRAVAEQLHLSIRTVENHLRSVYRKLGARSRRDLPGLLR